MDQQASTPKTHAVITIQSQTRPPLLRGPLALFGGMDGMERAVVGGGEVRIAVSSIPFVDHMKVGTGAGDNMTVGTGAVQMTVRTDAVQ
jgi:hypothetical protein